MRHPERVEDYLEHIAQAIERATEYVGRFQSLSAFQQSQLEQDAVIRNIEIIGEAANQIIARPRSSSRSIPSFRGRTCATCATPSFTPTLPSNSRLCGAPCRRIYRS